MLDPIEAPTKIPDDILERVRRLLDELEVDSNIAERYENSMSNPGEIAANAKANTISDLFEKEDTTIKEVMGLIYTIKIKGKICRLLSDNKTKYLHIGTKEELHEFLEKDGNEPKIIDTIRGTRLKIKRAFMGILRGK